MTRWYIRGNDGTCSDNTFGTDFDPLDNHCTGADMNSVSERDVTTENSPRRDVTMIVYFAIVVYRSPRVDDTVIADNASRLDHGTGHHLNPLAKSDVRGDNRVGMDQGLKIEALPSQTDKQFPAYAVTR